MCQSCLPCVSHVFKSWLCRSCLLSINRVCNLPMMSLVCKTCLLFVNHVFTLPIIFLCRILWFADRLWLPINREPLRPLTRSILCNATCSETPNQMMRRFSGFGFSRLIGILRSVCKSKDAANGRIHATAELLAIVFHTLLSHLIVNFVDFGASG